MAKAKSKNTATAITLAAIVAAGANGTFAPLEQLQEFVAAGQVEVNEAAANESGVAVRATQAGIDAVNAQGTHVNDGETVNVPQVQGRQKFVIDDSVPLPTETRGGRAGTSLYPFDELGVNQSFFVANDSKKEDAAKSLASTVSAANKRYSIDSPDGAMTTNRKGASVPQTIPQRKFVVRPYTQDGVAGARVWRTL